MPAQAKEKAARTYAQEDLDQVFHEFDSGQSGLSSKQAISRLKHFGANTIQKTQQEAQWKIFLKNFTSLMAILLWVSGVIAIVSGTLELGIAIWCVNIINGCFSYYQQHEAQKATDSMLAMLPTYTEVYRDNKLQQLDSKNLVPGDVFMLTAGDAIPVDARILQATSLQVDESALTGESVPESKEEKYAPGEGQFAETNMVYAGTSVVNGTCSCLTIATGMNTEFGKIAQLTHAQKKVASPLQIELNRLTRQLSIIAFGIGAAFFLASILFVHYAPAKAFIFALGMIVAFIPEGLLPTVTLSLAQGVKRMAKKHALVKELNSIETLGEATVICSDKTGTLTQNQMTVNHIWTKANTYTVSGQGYAVNGKVQLNDQDVAYKDYPDLKQALLISTLDNEAKIQADPKNPGQQKIVGTPTERALMVTALKAGFDIEAALKAQPRLQECPFDSQRKRMTTIHPATNGQKLVLVKGALDGMLPLCDQIQTDGKQQEITDADVKQIQGANEHFAAQGWRSLALAYKVADDPQAKVSTSAAESHLIFVGLEVMSDPPRAEVYQAVQKCHDARIRIIMVTGDSALTAKSIAVKIGITGDNARVVTGDELHKMTDDELKIALSGPVIFARVAPEQKYRIVSNLQARGEVVASTGDGVNDAPALKKADIGIAMGKMGTDVAKDAADMILTDDNFASIVAAIEEGRAVYSNIQKFLLYILNSNMPEAVPSALFLFTRGAIPLPLTVMQILTVDLGTDMLPALGLGSERAEPDVMKQPPRPRKAHLLRKNIVWKAFGWYGLMASTISSFAYFYTNFQLGRTWTTLATSGPIYREATTMTLAAIVFSQIAAVLNCRTQQLSVFSIGIFSNKHVWFGIAFEIVLLAVLIYTPFLQGVFNTTGIGLREWLFLICIPIPLFLIEEYRKYLSRKLFAHRNKLYTQSAVQH
ncbi:cation-translocating P-type ATPase [Agrilactobacillus composti]|uniref:cation-translocating P-type ATPase n=1 Tax=Agrilactobacillus composti TaxID=398555 RepID=UPI000704D78A|nr:cation-transporting P-type ATPase [Agrilactobacillus composti]